MALQSLKTNAKVLGIASKIKGGPMITARLPKTKTGPN